MSSQSPLNRRVLIFSPVGTSHSCCYVQSVSSKRQDSKLDSVSIGHVQFITSEPTDSQVPSLYCYIQFITSEW